MLTWTKFGIALDPDWSWSVGNRYQRSLYFSLAKAEKTQKLLSFLNIFLKFETSSLTFAPMIVSFSTYFWLKLSFEKSSASVGVKTLKTRFLVKMPTVWCWQSFIQKWFVCIALVLMTSIKASEKSQFVVAFKNPWPCMSYDDTRYLTFCIN